MFIVKKKKLHIKLYFDITQMLVTGLQKMQRHKKVK